MTPYSPTSRPTLPPRLHCSHTTRRTRAHFCHYQLLPLPQRCLHFAIVPTRAALPLVLCNVGACSCSSDGVTYTVTIRDATTGPRSANRLRLNAFCRRALPLLWEAGRCAKRRNLRAFCNLRHHCWRKCLCRTLFCFAHRDTRFAHAPTPARTYRAY